MRPDARLIKEETREAAKEALVDTAEELSDRDVSLMAAAEVLDWDDLQSRTYMTPDEVRARVEKTREVFRKMLIARLR